MNLIAAALGSHHGRNDPNSMGTYVVAGTVQSGPHGYAPEAGEGIVVVNAFNGYTGGADDNDAQAGHIVLSAHAFGVRRLTPLEAERLQGFPDHWTAGQSDSMRYRQLGNAVCVPVAEWLGRRIIEVDNLP